MAANTNKKRLEAFTPLSHYRVEEYFYEKDRALVRKLRETADRARKKREAEQRKALHWMKCPKCGSSMQDVELYHVKVEQCTQCHGIYLDNAELEILIKMQKEEDFLTRLSKRWQEKITKLKFPDSTGRGWW